jgi:hypothetical protein
MIEMIDPPARVFRTPAGYRRLTINLAEDLHTALKVHAIEQDTTVTNIIERLVVGELTDKDVV